MTGVGNTSLSSASIRSGDIIVPTYHSSSQCHRQDTSRSSIRVPSPITCSSQYSNFSMRSVHVSPLHGGSRLQHGLQRTGSRHASRRSGSHGAGPRLRGLGGGFSHIKLKSPMWEHVWEQPPRRPGVAVEGAGRAAHIALARVVRPTYRIVNGEPTRDTWTDTSHTTHHHFVLTRAESMALSPPLPDAEPGRCLDAAARGGRCRRLSATTAAAAAQRLRHRGPCGRRWRCAPATCAGGHKWRSECVPQALHLALA